MQWADALRVELHLNRLRSDFPDVLIRATAERMGIMKSLLETHKKDLYDLEKY